MKRRSAKSLAPRGDRRPTGPRRATALRRTPGQTKGPQPLLEELRQLIDGARLQVGRAVNAGMTLLYWRIGTRIRKELLRERRADYGARIVATLSRQLGWSHFKELVPIDHSLRRDFYAEMCRTERWSVRTLRQKIDGMLYERPALSRKPEKLIRKELDQLRAEDRLTPDLVFQDPYLLDFLGLRGSYSERDLESALLREIERFLLELGTGFTFVERQKRITVDGDDYYVDLLFFHRRLRRLVVLELKLGDFKPTDKGQVELYLRWLDRHERQPGEGPPLAMILCAGKKRETVEYLDLGRSGIHVAEYLTALPPRELLEGRLQAALAHARGKQSPLSGKALAPGGPVRPPALPVRVTRRRKPLC